MRRIHVTLAALLMLVWIAPTVGAQGLSIGTGTAFSLGASTLNLSGNWSNAGTFTAGSGTVVFNGSDGNQTVANASGETFHHVTVNKTAGDVQLLNDVSVTGTLTVTGGDVDLNGKFLTLGSSGMLSESAGVTVKGVSGYITTTRDLNAPAGEDVAGMGAVITSSANLGTTTINRGHAPQTGTGNVPILRYYDIAPANNAGLDATFVFKYDDSELNGLTEANLILFRSTDGGTVWTNQGGTVETAGNMVTKTGIPGFSRWTAGDSDHPLTAPEIDVRGKGVSIADGDTIPDTADNTDFGSAGLVSGGITHIFTVANIGSDILTLTDPSPYVVISGIHAGDFSVSSIPSGSIAAGGGATTFAITFTPGAVGLREATVSIANNDFNENPYNFAIQGTVLPDVTVSGTVTDGVNPIAGAIVTFSHDGHTETTAADATYSYVVSSGTTTTMTPSHPGYASWTPANRQLASMLTDQSGQDFQATINTYAVSGTVTDGVNPIGGATITFSHDGHTETTAADGTYSYMVNYNTTTTVTPSHPGYASWNPANRQLANIPADQPGQDFQATINTYAVSGTVTDGVNPIAGATITFSHDGHTETTAADGTYSYMVNYNTTTTVTPSHPGYASWNPANRQLANIPADQPGQDFISTSDTDGVSTAEESGPNGTDPSYDGNGDEIPDRNQSNVTSFHTSDGEKYVTLAAPNGTQFSGVEALPEPAPGIFSDTIFFPCGLFRFTISGVMPGGAIQIRLILSGGAYVSSYWKYGREPGDTTVHPYEFMLTEGTGAEITRSGVILHFVDGQRGDDDLTGNGTVVDDGGPTYLTTEIPSLSGEGMIVFVILLSLIACWMMRRRKRSA